MSVVPRRGCIFAEDIEEGEEEVGGSVLELVLEVAVAVASSDFELGRGEGGCEK